MFGFREVVQITLGPNLRLRAINISWIIWRKNRQYIFYLGLSWSKKGTLRVQSVTKVYWNALKLTKKLTKYLLLRYKNPAISCRFTSVCLFPSQIRKIMFERFIFLVNPHVVKTSHRTLYIHFVDTYPISRNSKF